MMAEKKKKKVKNRSKKTEAAIQGYNSVYFYYLKYGSPIGDEPDEVRCYYYFDQYSVVSDLESRIAALVNNAYFNGDSPICYGSSFTDLLRRRKGYFVIAVDGRQFNNVPFRFSKINKGSDPDSPGDYTFDRARRLTVSISEPNGSKRTIDVGYCLNDMQSQIKYNNHIPGDLDPNEEEKFHLQLSFQGHHMYPDSGGTNMGPPIGPP